MPETADDDSPEGADAAEPERAAVPTESPVAATDYGVTSNEEAAGEPLERKLSREMPNPAVDHDGEDADAVPREERAAPAAEEQLSVSDVLTGQPDGEMPEEGDMPDEPDMPGEGDVPGEGSDR